MREKGFTALKTNIFLYEGGKPRGWRPGFGVPFLPELNVDKHVLRNLRTHLAAMREGAGPACARSWTTATPVARTA